MKNLVAVAVGAASIQVGCASIQALNDAGEALKLGASPTKMCGTESAVNALLQTECTLEAPCPVALGGGATKDDCGSCYLVTLRQAEKEHYACRGGVCPAVESTVVVQVVEFHHNDETKFGFYQQVWEALCPTACRKANICTTDASDCGEGVFRGSVFHDMSTGSRLSLPIAGSMHLGRLPVAWQKIDCENGKFIEGNRGGDDGVGQIPVGQRVLDRRVSE